MFKISKKTTFTWPVTVQVPQDGGVFKPYEFIAEFKMQTQSEIDALLELSKANDKDMLKAVLVGWDQVQDSDGNPLPFSEESLSTLTDITYVRTGLVKSFFEAVSGNKAKK